MEAKTHTVLIVEDEADLRNALETVLSQQGFSVATAVDGEEGLAKALAEKPDLILLDIMMPKMDGITVLKNLRIDTWGAHAKVIVMTASGDFSKVAEVVELGGKDYVVKTDISMGEIVEKIKKKLGVDVD